MVKLLQRNPLLTTHGILCVDDEPAILEALALTLGHRYQVEMAPSGKSALEILSAMPDPAVIISDMRMPSMNGAQFLAASRKIAPNARRILLTGHANTASAILAVNEGGIFRFLTKPCPFATLVEAVEAAIADFDRDSHRRSAFRSMVTKDLLSQDALTGLASREILLERLDQCRGDGETDDWRSEVVLVIEILDVAESSGFDSDTADRFIRLLATKLRQWLCNAVCVARHRETTFVALVASDDLSDAALVAYAAGIVSLLEQPLDLDGVIMQTRAAVGIARIPARAGDPRSALRHAELAARDAQRFGVDPVRLSCRDSIILNERRRETIQALRIAVKQQELTLHYQPIIDIQRNRVYSVEALARWEHARLGFVSAGTFIPLAEEIGLMIPLGEWVMKRACVDGHSLSSTVFGRVSVNVSVAQILDSRFMQSLVQAIETSGLNPSALELELTETVFSEDLDRVCKLLCEVRLLGVSVAIDDFGAGYSSLAYLARLPVDVLKIDRTFVQDLDAGGEAIIGAALAVARTLKLDVIVEGVETALQLERVRALGATKIQGFLFAHPMPAAELMSWYATFANRRVAVTP